MKVTFDIECTPDEARQFLGLPDVVPMQDELMKQMQARLSENIRQMDPESLAKTWVPLSMQGWGEMQKAFWGQMNVNGFGASPSRASTSRDDDSHDEDEAPRRSSANGRKTSSSRRR